MKKTILSLFLLIQAGFIFAQNNVTVFSEDGYPFYLILNGVRQNEAPETNIRLEGLSQETFTAKVIFNDESIPAIDKKFFMVANDECRPCDVTYKVKTSKKGEVVLKVFTFNQLQTAPPPPANVKVVQYNTTPMPPVVFGTSMHISETTTTTTTGGGSSDNVNMDINVGGVNMGVNVNINDGGFHDGHSHTQTHTHTTTTYTTQQVAPVVVAEPIVTCTMDNNSFQTLMSSLQNKTWDDDKLIVAKQATSTNCMTAMQVKQIMGTLEWEDNRLDFAKYAYNSCHDQNNYWQVNDAFEWSSSVDELNETIGK